MFEHAIQTLEIQLETSTSNLGITDSQEGLVNSTEIIDDLKNSIDYLKNSEVCDFGNLVSLVREWGKERNIIGDNAKATTQTQFVKLLEEVEELNVAIAVPDHAEIVDGIGDCTVVLILLAELAGIRFEDCLLSAYNEIKGRTGTMVDGQFLKDCSFPKSITKDDFDEPLPERTCTDGEACESCQ